MRHGRGKFWSRTWPHPLPSIRAIRPAFTGRVRLTRMLALDKVPHLVKLYLGDRQGPQQVAVDLLGLMGRTSEPAQHRLFRDPEYKADAGQIHSDQEHLEGHHDFVFRSAEVEKDRLACLREGRLTGVTAKDTSLAALGEIRRNSTHVALPHASIIDIIGFRFGCTVLGDRELAADDDNSHGDCASHMQSPSRDQKHHRVSAVRHL